MDLVEFEKRQAPLPNGLYAILEGLIQKEWIVKEGSTIRLSEQGLLFYDSVAEEII